MCNAVRSEKQLLRKKLIAAHRRLDRVTRAEYDRRIIKRLFCLPYWALTGTLFCYVGIGWEIATEELIDAAILSGRRVAVPLCLPDGMMEAHEIRSLDELIPGAYGIPEPRRESPVLTPEAFDLAVIPAVAFDRTGCRLGRGGGYYDRYLGKLRGVRAGLCYEQFLLPAVPQEAHDIKMDYVITEEGEYAWV